MANETLLKNTTEKFELYQMESDRVSLQVDSALLIAASTILAVSVIIGKPATVHEGEESLYHILSSTTILLNTLCILSLGISLLGYVIRVNQIRDSLRRSIVDILHHPDELPGVALNTSIPKGFLICEKVAYISFLLFIICLTATGFIK